MHSIHDAFRNRTVSCRIVKQTKVCLVCDLCWFCIIIINSVNDLVLSICKGQYDFSDPVWNEVSAEAKDLISKCLTVDPAARIHPQEVI